VPGHAPACVAFKKRAAPHINNFELG